MGQRAIGLLERDNGNYDVHYTKWLDLDMSSEQFNEDNPLGGYFRSNIIELNGTKYEDVTRGEARKVSIMKDAYTVVLIDEDYEINVISYEEL